MSAFEKQTDIPLEIPFFVTLHLLSADLLKRKVTIDFQGQIIRPDLWTVVLAESGAGKTFTANRLMDMTGAEDTFPDQATAARFIEELQSHNNSLWIRDEFGQFLKTLDTQSTHRKLKTFFCGLMMEKKWRGAPKNMKLLSKIRLSLFSG